MRRLWCFMFGHDFVGDPAITQFCQRCGKYIWHRPGDRR